MERRSTYKFRRLGPKGAQHCAQLHMGITCELANLHAIKIFVMGFYLFHFLLGGGMADGDFKNYHKN